MIDAKKIVIDRTKEIACIPAPTFAEQDRAVRIRDWWMQDGINPLLDACSRGDTAIVKVLLSASGVNTNIVGRVSWR